MACECCSSGGCCDGSSCNEKTKSQCASEGGTPTTSCASQTCIDDGGTLPCTQENACSCASKGKRTLAGLTTCNCNTLSSYVANGGCRSAYCEVCDSNGSCVLTCPTGRSCCAGTCCPIHQQCASGQCVNKCQTGTTFCQGTGSSFECCPSSKKCCGSDGCKSFIPTAGAAEVTIDLSKDEWAETGITVPANTTVEITATGSGSTGAPFFGLPSSPTGIGANEFCDSFPQCTVTGACVLSLIGRVGGTTFYVGSSYSGQPGAGGLQLRANNTCVSNVTGSYKAEVKYVSNGDPCPNYTPFSVGEPIVYAAGQAPSGPGSELKALLRLAGIVASPTCSCNARAAQMDVWGEWDCLKRIPEICGWLKEEAEKRDLWFFPPAGAALILAAISLSALKRPFRGNSK